ncbi:hypothetical protein CY34DRAFT_806384 [Suillus luteus UH-Slu-Lm8-n1]|uniref:Uncharacterized protein n=1 Tax=Suillus luteus UH-Slu-Lm8-n1 TaxID=930992 RepID=A0A0C9ZTG9_9AGAM|nr:hypothetical protein CY34DRAFT_806384 [Suillus luteus UH-Slu-Lm8-n1]
MRGDVPLAASRKFIDLIHQASSMWANWDSPSQIRVGDYGMIDNTTGELVVQGNIYDDTFQTFLNNQGLKIDLSEPSCQPQQGEIDDSMIITSSGVKQIGLSMSSEVSSLNLASASLKVKCQFPEGKRGAVLAMYKPKRQYIPQGKVLTHVYKARPLHDKHLVTSTFTCSGYCMYLSNKSGKRIAMALIRSPPIPAAAGLIADGAVSMDWWTDAQAAFLRKAVDKSGVYCYTPLYTLKHRQNSWIPRLFRGEEEEETEDDLWPDCAPPWQPLDDDGNEDPV